MAAQKAGLHQVPIVVLDLNDSETLEVAIVENIQRENLNPIEEAKGYERLHKEFGYDHEKIAKFISKSRSHVSNTLRLLTLPKDVISMLEEGLIAPGQARPLIGLSNASEIAEDILKKRLTSRQVESLSKANKNPLKLERQIDSNIEEAKKLIEIPIFNGWDFSSTHGWNFFHCQPLPPSEETVAVSFPILAPPLNPLTSLRKLGLGKHTCYFASVQSSLAFACRTVSGVGDRKP